MASDYLFYWKPKTVKQNIDGKSKLKHAASEQYSLIKPGDTIWIITRLADGIPMLLGRFVVDILTDHKTAAKLLGSNNLWVAKHHVLTDPEKAEVGRFVDISDIVADLRFESERDRLKVIKGTVRAQQLQKMRTLTPESAELLRAKWEEDLSITGDPNQPDSSVLQGGGFGKPESNKEVEMAAVDIVTKELIREGWAVESVETQKIGFDLLCSKKGNVLHVEVKGTKGVLPNFIITQGERLRAETDPKFWLYLVTDVMGKSPQLHRFSGEDLNRQFEFSPLAYRAIYK